MGCHLFRGYVSFKEGTGRRGHVASPNQQFLSESLHGCTLQPVKKGLYSFGSVLVVICLLYTFYTKANHHFELSTIWKKICWNVFFLHRVRVANQSCWLFGLSYAALELGLPKALPKHAHRLPNKKPKF